MVESALYEGSVYHRRSADTDHEFSVSLFMVYLDLGELPNLFDDIPGFSARSPAPFRYLRADHFGDPQRSLESCVREKARSLTGRSPDGPVRLLTHIRYFGYLFNPVSFYYCYNNDGTLGVVLAEVHNTPWNEEHVYGLPAAEKHGREGFRSVSVDKDFHVSPFQPMKQTYDISFDAPGENLQVAVQSYREGERELTARLAMERRPFTVRELYAHILRHPFMTMKVTGTIYFQALRLWWKGSTFYSHPRHGTP